MYTVHIQSLNNLLFLGPIVSHHKGVWSANIRGYINTHNNIHYSYNRPIRYLDDSSIAVNITLARDKNCVSNPVMGGNSKVGGATHSADESAVCLSNSAFKSEIVSVKLCSSWGRS